jgi:hypothetical protein
VAISPATIRSYQLWAPATAFTNDVARFPRKYEHCWGQSHEVQISCAGLESRRLVLESQVYLAAEDGGLRASAPTRLRTALFCQSRSALKRGLLSRLSIFPTNSCCFEISSFDQLHQGDGISRLGPEKGSRATASSARYIKRLSSLPISPVLAASRDPRAAVRPPHSPQNVSRVMCPESEASRANATAATQLLVAKA